MLPAIVPHRVATQEFVTPDYFGTHFRHGIVNSLSGFLTIKFWNWIGGLPGDGAAAGSDKEAKGNYKSHLPLRVTSWYTVRLKIIGQRRAMCRPILGRFFTDYLQTHGMLL